MSSRILFKEAQRFRQWWLWLTLVFIAANSLWITVNDSYPFREIHLNFIEHENQL